MIKPLTLDGFAPDGVVYGFFGRHGGSSTGIFASLNCKQGAGDDDAHVASNRARVCDVLGTQTVTTLTQVHGNTCHTLTAPLEQGEGDALVTAVPGIAIGVLTADCAPVLFYGRTGNDTPVIGAAHAGWGGAVKGILESTLDAMEKEGAQRRTIQAAIGPCIAKLSYEVSPEFLTPFLADDPASESFFMALQSGKYLFDLPAYCRFRLTRAGVRQIVVGGQDTYKDEDEWFSFRRSTHRGESQYGRQISAICIRSS